jgi:hypothetical protein
MAPRSWNERRCIVLCRIVLECAVKDGPDMLLGTENRPVLSFGRHEGAQTLHYQGGVGRRELAKLFDDLIVERDGMIIAQHVTQLCQLPGVVELGGSEPPPEGGKLITMRGQISGCCLSPHGPKVNETLANQERDGFFGAVEDSSNALYGVGAGVTWCAFKEASDETGVEGELAAVVAYHEVCAELLVLIGPATALFRLFVVL